MRERRVRSHFLMKTGKPSRSEVCIATQMTAPFIEQALNCVHSAWPAWARAIPDFTADSIGDNECKLEIKAFSQLDWYSCAASAGWAIVKTFHRRSRFRDFYRDCNPQPLRGTSEYRLVRALRRHSIGVSVRTDLTFAAVHGALERGFPVIVQIGHEYADGDHFVVIHGYGWRPNRIFICNQPRAGFSRQELKWSEFRSMWTPRGRGLICWGK